MTYATAREAANRAIRAVVTNFDTAHLVILDHLSREESFGWVFFYDDRRFVETGKIEYFLCGNLPVVVTHDGAVCYLPWAHWKDDIEDATRAFKRSLTP